MFIKEFFQQQSRVKSPVDPGKSVLTYKWVWTGANVVEDSTNDLRFVDEVGDGWIDVEDADLADQMLASHRIIPGNRATAGWFTQADAQIQVAAGFMDEDEVSDIARPARAPTRRLTVPAAPKAPGAPAARGQVPFSPGASGVKPRRTRDRTTDGAVPNTAERGTSDLFA